MSASSSETPIRDRKKSAHWTERDTEILVNILLRHKDSGRTSDNGFKPEVWREISDLLERTMVSGGPKTSEACKSRWQRLQRDYKAAKEMETVPGFSWDHGTNKLSASAETWETVERQWEGARWQRLHIPWYNSVAILCPDDKIRPGSITRSRKSLGSSSDASSLFSMSVSSGPPHTPQLTAPVHANGQIMVHGSVPMHGMTVADGNGGFVWDPSDMDGEGEYDSSSFAMMDGSHQAFHTQMHNQKRTHYDPVSNTGSTSAIQLHLPQPSPPKRSRPNLAESSSNASRHMRTDSSGHAHAAFHIPLPPAPTFNNGPLRSPNEFRSPGYHSAHAMTEGGTMLDPSHFSPTTPISTHQMQQQQPQARQAQMHQQAQAQAHEQAQGQQHTQMHHATRPQQNQPSQLLTTQPASHLPRPVPPQPLTPEMHSQGQQGKGKHRTVQLFPPARNLPLSPPFDQSTSSAPSALQPSLQANVQQPNSLTEDQRRTQAVIQLQSEADLPEEDMVEVMDEFEVNVAAADMYLATKTPSLRSMWLKRLLARRKRVDATRR